MHGVWVGMGTDMAGMGIDKAPTRCGGGGYTLGGDRDRHDGDGVGMGIHGMEIGIDMVGMGIESCPRAAV